MARRLPKLAAVITVRHRPSATSLVAYPFGGVKPRWIATSWKRLPCCRRQPRTGGPRGSATPKIVPTSAEAEAVSRRTPRRGTFGTASTPTSRPSWPRWIHFLPTIAITTTKPCWRRPIVCWGRVPAPAWSWSASSATGKREQLPSAAFRADGCKLSVSSKGVGPPYNDGNGHQKNLDVQQQRPIGDIDEIVFEPAPHLFGCFGLAAQAVNLGPTGDARLHSMSCQIAVDECGVFLIVRCRMWPRSDQRH